MSTPQTLTAIFCDHALGYARLGLRVFPLLPGGKTPLTPKGFKDATTDPTVVATWAAVHPNANIGYNPNLDEIVIDVDPRNGGHESLACLLATHGSLPPTRSVRTGGGGMHYYFKNSGPTITQWKKHLAPGIDIKHSNGYVLLPPSETDGVYEVVDDLPFAEIPEWIIDLGVKDDGDHFHDSGDRVDPEYVFDGIPEGERNERLFSYASSLRARNQPKVEAVLLVRAAMERCGYDKDPKHETAEQLVERVYKTYPAGTTKPAASPPSRSGDAAHEVILAPASGFRPEPVRSAWEGRVPLGMVTLLVGVPGKGKSTLTVELVARASRGQLPGDLFGRPVTVALATAEDAISQVVVPRLLAAGADLDRVKIIQVRHGEGSIGGLSLPDDIDKLREELIMAEARIVVVDPLVAHIVGSINTWKDQDVRRVLAPIAHLAEEADAAVIGVMHLNKNQTSDVLNKVGGSVGFGAAARSVLFFATDPEDPDPESYKRILAHAKCNVGPLAPALRFRVEGREVQGDVGVTIKTSAIAWCGEARGVSAADLVVEPATAEDRQAKTTKEQEIEEAMEVIRQLITGATTEAEAVQHELKRLGIRERVWREAKARLGVRSKKSSFKAGWEWVLPEGGQRLPYKPEPVAFDKERENDPAKYPNNTEDDEGDEGGQRSEGGRAVCTPSETTKTDEGDEEVEDGREYPSGNGFARDEAYWKRHDRKVIDIMRASARAAR